MAARRRDRPRPLKIFGKHVRRYREVSNLSLRELAAKTAISDSHISKIENGDTKCSREFAVTLDGSLGAGGALSSLWDDLVADAAVPGWFDWPDIEKRTIQLIAYENCVVYGLLQTEAYASVLLGDPGELAFRMERQEILHRDEPTPPRLVVLLSEVVLHNLIGSPEVMRDQLQHLIDISSPRVSVQVVPGPVPPAATSGAFCLATLGDSDRSEVAYVETPARGFTLGEPVDIQTLSDAMSDIRASALPVGQSRDHIRRVVEERWT